MLYSEIKKILEEKIAGIEELKSIENKFHQEIEYKIDGMVNKRKKDEDNHDIPFYDLDTIIEEAKKLTVQVFKNFQGNSAWIKNNWNEIEKKLRYNLRNLEK